VESNYPEGIKWLRRAADLGSVSAQSHLGYCYFRGYGVTQDFVEGEKLLRQAAAQHDRSAQYHLGCLYHFGHVVPLHPFLAFYWWPKRDPADDTLQENVGLSNERGEPFVPDYVEAYKWMSLASDGSLWMKKQRHRITAKMTPEQREESQQRIEEFRRSAKKAGDVNSQGLIGVVGRLAQKGDPEARALQAYFKLMEEAAKFPLGSPAMTETTLKALDFQRHAENLAKSEPNYERTQISAEVRREVWRRDQGRCTKCSSREKLEYDHIIPVSEGGGNTARNIELLCESCNRAKAARIE
jgi:hypothetical protein